MKLYPLTFEPIYFTKIWGGDKLNDLYFRKIPFGNIGESWEIIDFEERKSEIATGELKGKSIDIIFNSDFMGDFVAANYNRFPLIIKYLDAKDDLSVQVHPKEGDNIKNEIWYFIQEPLSNKIVCGIDKSYSTQDITSHLKYLKVSKGDFAFIPSGAVHALTAGSFILEIQQASDTTYRIYDWDRLDDEGQSRELHIEEAKDHIQTHYEESHFCDEIQVVKELKYAKIFCVRKTPHFCIEKINIHKEVDLSSLVSSFSVLNVVEGKIRIDTSAGEYSFNSGSTVFIPAKLGDYSIFGEAMLIHTYME
jgi:mannose-6-phosphate isomerase